MAVNDTMMRNGVMSQLLGQRNAKILLSGREGWKPLLFAAENGYGTLVKEMLEKGAFIEAYDPEDYNEERKSMTSLSLAAMNGHETVVEILLEKGANMSRHYRLAGTPLAWAVRNGHSSVVQLLVEKGSDIEDDALERRTPLSWAVSTGHEAIVMLLLKHGADPTRKEPNKDDTPLSRAAEKGRKVMVQIILESRTKFDESCIKFALICAVGAAQKSPGSLLLGAVATADVLDILDAMAESHWEADDRREDFDAVVMMLCAKGAYFRESSNPLITAAIAGNERMVRLFLNCGAQVNYIGTRVTSVLEGDYSGTALAFAIRYGHKDLAEVLLAEGAHLEARAYHGRLPFVGASVCDHWGTTKLLLEKTPDAKIRECNWTLPSYAVGGGREDIVKMLLARGIDFDARDNEQGMSLHFAAMCGHENIIRSLVEDGADIKVRDDDCQTPLHLAAANGHEDSVRVLLENGADIESRDSFDRTPLCLAAQEGHESSVRVLLENGADIGTRDSRDRMPLHLAAETGHENIVGLLLKNGADIESKDIGHRTALSCAADGGRKIVVKVLLENGADIEAKDWQGRTPLIRAYQGNRNEVVTLLLESGANPHAGLERRRRR